VRSAPFAAYIAHELRTALATQRSLLELALSDPDADIAVWRDTNIGTGIPTIAPFLVIEILSPEDRMVRMLPKIQEYLSIGVEWVWVIDPEEKSALLYSQKNPAGALCDILRTESPALEIPLSRAFDLNA